jgi:hypothetical protein
MADAERTVWRRKRITERVAARLWVRMRGTLADIECTTLDVSETGTRLRILLRDVGLDKDAGLFDLSRIVTKAFGDGCVAELRHPRGTEWVRKNLCLVRLGVLRKQAGDFEVGCRFDTELTEAERTLLGFERTVGNRDAG